VAALVLACLAGAGPSAGAGETEPDPGEGGIGIQLVDAPVSRRDDPRALRYIIDHLAPGTVIQRNILVVNNSGVPQHVELYPAAATVENGQFVFGAERAANELTSWTSLQPAAVDLAPGEQDKSLVTISVPLSAPAGERYAVVWAVVASDPAAGNVRQVHRVGVRVYLDVGPGGEMPTAFTFGRLTAIRDEQGRPVVAVEVANTGGRAVDLSGTATLTDGPGGVSAGPFDVRGGTTLAPAQTGTVTVRFPRELPDGPWTIEVHLESGTVKSSTTARITFTGEIQVTGTSAVPWMQITGGVIVFVLASLTIGGLVFRARRRGYRYVHAPRGVA
jgi:hypothetical protein